MCKFEEEWRMPSSSNNQNFQKIETEVGLAPFQRPNLTKFLNISNDRKYFSLYAHFALFRTMFNGSQERWRTPDTLLDYPDCCAGWQSLDITLCTMLAHNDNSSHCQPRPTLTTYIDITDWVTDTRRKGCDELANSESSLDQICGTLNIEHVVDLWTPSSPSFMTRVSLTNCQLNCCPLPQPGPVFALVCHIMCHWSPPAPRAPHFSPLLWSHKSRGAANN